jgi:glycosyltransferase involved in cell wall biosynthesis
MKIVHINSTFNKGSTGRILYDIHNLLKENNIITKVFYGRIKQDNDDDIYYFGNKISNLIHGFITRLFDMHGRGSIFYTNQLIRKIKNISPDIVHIHNIHGYYLNYPILFNFFKKSTFKVVWTFHDAWPFTGHCAYFDYANCNKWKVQCYSCPEIKSYPKSFLFDNSYNNYNLKKLHFTSLGSDQLTVVTPSKWLKEKVDLSFFSKYKSIVINNGISTNIFNNTKSNFRDKNNLHNYFLILGVAKPWTRRKGLSFFIELSYLIPNNYKIVLVGLSDEDKKNIPDSIIAIPPIKNSPALAEIYSAVDVFVNPTLEDNFPTTNLEALSCGTPVITFDTGGCSEVVNDSVGFVVNMKTSKELLNAINIIYKKTKSFYSENCVKTVLSNYNKDFIYLSYLNLYKSIIS